MDYIVNKMISSFLKRDLIKEEDIEIYSFGLKQGIILIINFVTIALLGFALEVFLEAILFMVMFIPIRVYAGGYHKRSQLECYVFSTLVLAIIFLIIKSQPITNNYIILLISIISGIVIFCLAPVEDRNKPLDEKEIEVFGKRARRNLCIIFAILVLTLLLGKTNISFCISLAILSNCCLVVAGKLSNKVANH